MKNNMGKVVTRIRVENWLDAELLAAGTRKEKPRSVETDSLVDTGAVKFYLNSSVIRLLGLRPIGKAKMRTMSNRASRGRFFQWWCWRFKGAPAGLMWWKFQMSCQTL
jgi:hypothetical protein